MKKYCILSIAVLLFISSCTKQASEINNLYNENRIFHIDDNSKASASYFTVKIGHSASGCNGCIKIDGINMHVSCQGHGTECEAKASIAISQDSIGFYTIKTINKYELTAENYFLMPDRSLFVEMNDKIEVWLNIPAQLSIRDSVSEQFTFHNLFYSNYAVYKNQ